MIVRGQQKYHWVEMGLNKVSGFHAKQTLATFLPT